MPRTIPLLLFPSLLATVVGAALAVGHASSFGPYADDDLAWILRNSPYEGERAAAVEELSDRRAGRDAIAEGTADRSAAVRLQAYVALARRGDEKAFPMLLALADDPDPRVRMHTLRGISFSDDPSVRQRLEKAAAEDPDPDVRLYARRLLGR